MNSFWQEYALQDAEVFLEKAINNPRITAAINNCLVGAFVVFPLSRCRATTHLHRCDTDLLAIQQQIHLVYQVIDKLEKEGHAAAFGEHL